MTDDKSKRRKENRQYVYNYLNRNPCGMCGETDPACLEFDHLDPTRKRHSVSTLVHKGAPLDILRREIRACQVVCASCHRRKTAREQGWYRDLMTEEQWESYQASAG